MGINQTYRNRAGQNAYTITLHAHGNLQIFRNSTTPASSGGRAAMRPAAQVAIRQFLDSLSRHEMRISRDGSPSFPGQSRSLRVAERAASRDLNRSFGPIAQPEPGADSFVNPSARLCAMRRAAGYSLLQGPGIPVSLRGPEKPQRWSRSIFPPKNSTLPKRWACNAWFTGGSLPTTDLLRTRSPDSTARPGESATGRRRQTQLWNRHHGILSLPGREIRRYGGVWQPYDETAIATARRPF